MYEERRAFPVKWIVIGLIIISLIVGSTVYISYRSNQKDMEYKDLLERIKKAGEAYGKDNFKSIELLDEKCVTLDELIPSYLKSDSKKEKVIYNPKTKKKMAGYVKVWIQDEKVFSRYIAEGICQIDYEDKIKLEIKEKNSHSFIATILVDDDGIGLNSFEYKIDDEKFFIHDSKEYKFDELLSGNHKIAVKAKDYLGRVYEMETDVLIEPLMLPEINFDETENSTIVVCPNESDEKIICAYTVDSETWIAVNAETEKYVFKENGKIIAKATDGYNITEPVIKEITIIPNCVDTEWDVCTGCTAICGSSCEGIQTSNCGNTRPCQIVGNCVSSVEKPSTYTVTVKASNGTPETQSYDVVKGYNRVFTVTPQEGYVYSSVKCNEGTATFATKTNQLTVKNISNPRTCNVYFTKKAVPPTTYTVSFNGFNGQLLDTKKVTSGQKVDPINAPAVSGYDFVSWMRNGVNYNFSEPVTSNMSLTANYVGNRYTITFDSNGGSNTLPQYIIAGEKAYRPPNPTKTAYHFTNWTFNGQVYNFLGMVNNDFTLVANWAPLIFRHVSFDGVVVTKGVSLSGYGGLHNITSDCVGGFSHIMSDSTITISLNRAEACTVSVSYY